MCTAGLSPQAKELAEEPVQATLARYVAEIKNLNRHLDECPHCNRAEDDTEDWCRRGRDLVMRVYLTAVLANSKGAEVDGQTLEWVVSEGGENGAD